MFSHADRTDTFTVYVDELGEMRESCYTFAEDPVAWDLADRVDLDPRAVRISVSPLPCPGESLADT